MTLPNDLDIFLPWASRTIPWMATTSKGVGGWKWQPNISIRATQKKMMSYPVTSTDVG